MRIRIVTDTVHLLGAVPVWNGRELTVETDDEQAVAEARELVRSGHAVDVDDVIVEKPETTPISQMTVAELRDHLGGLGIDAPADARKADLYELAREQQAVPVLTGEQPPTDPPTDETES